MIRKVLTWPNKALVADSENVGEVNGSVVFDEELLELISDLQETMNAYQAQGIAAPQVGVNKRVFLVHIPEDNVRVFINPKIVDRAEDLVSNIEGCLSFPGVRIPVKRPEDVTISYVDITGETKVMSFSGTLGVAIQHEYDHVEGLKMLDRISTLDQAIVKRRMMKIKRWITPPTKKRKPSKKKKRKKRK